MLSTGLYLSIGDEDVAGLNNDPITGGGGGATDCSFPVGLMLAKICDKFDGIDIFANTFDVDVELELND